MDKPVQTVALAAERNPANMDVRGLFCSLARTRINGLFELVDFEPDDLRRIEAQASLLRERAQFGIDSVSECLAVALASGELAKYPASNVAWTLKLLQELVAAAGQIMDAVDDNSAAEYREATAVSARRDASPLPN